MRVLSLGLTVIEELNLAKEQNIKQITQIIVTALDNLIKIQGLTKKEEIIAQAETFTYNL
jgi:hypothetical protein